MSIDRKEGIGGSDIGAVAGVSPYEGPHGIYLKKRGLIPEEEPNEAMGWGTRLEDLIADRYAEVTGTKLVRSPALIKESFPLMRGTPDRIVDGDKLLEIKTAGARQDWRWGPEGTDEIPPEYLCQVAWYLALTDLPRADVAVLIGGQDFRVYHVSRDLELEERLVDAAARFWRDHVIPGKPPPVDGSDQSREYLRRAFPQETSATMLKANEDQRQLAIALASARHEFDRAKKLKTKAENLLKEAIGPNLGIEGPDFKITWKAAKQSMKTDWEAVARDLGAFRATELVDAMHRYTHPAGGARRFLARFEGEENDDE